MPLVRRTILATFRRLSFSVLGLALGGLWAGVGWAQTPRQPLAPPPPTSFHVPVTSGLIRAYQMIISPSKGSHCPMSPHCSAFGLQAFRSRNPIMAFIMTSDRLHRCGHDLKYYELTFVDDQPRFADPVAASPAVAVLPDEELAPKAAPRGTHADDRPMDDPPAARLLDFAESLEAWGDYPRAITEYLRFLHDFPDDPHSGRAQVGLIRAHYYHAEYEEVIRLGRQAPPDCSPEGVAEIQYYVGLAFLNVKNHGGARRVFEQVRAAGIEPYGSKAAMLSATCLAREFRWREAGDAFLAIGPDSPYVDFARRDVAVCADGASPQLKSPSTAGLMSVVPGLGYLYAGYPKTAISAFLVTSGFIWATIEAFDRDNQGLGALLSLLSFGWYSGNIFGAIGSADRYNAWVTQTTLARLEFGFAF